MSGADRVRLCGDVKLSLPNSADCSEFPDRVVGPGSAQQAPLSEGSALVNPSIQKVRTKFIKKNEIEYHEAAWGCSLRTSLWGNHQYSWVVGFSHDKLPLVTENNTRASIIAYEVAANNGHVMPPITPGARIGMNAR